MRLKVLYSVAKPFFGGGFRFFKNMKVFLTDQGICCFFWRRNLKENHHHHLLLLLLLVFFYGSLLQKKKRTIGEDDYSFLFFLFYFKRRALNLKYLQGGYFKLFHFEAMLARCWCIISAALRVLETRLASFGYTFFFHWLHSFYQYG